MCIQLSYCTVITLHLHLDLRCFHHQKCLNMVQCCRYFGDQGRHNKIALCVGPISAMWRIDWMQEIITTTVVLLSHFRESLFNGIQKWTINGLYGGKYWHWWVELSNHCSTSTVLEIVHYGCVRGVIHNDI